MLAASGTGNVSVSSATGISITGGGSITTVGGSITMDADTGGGGGAITIGDGSTLSTIASNGGAITIGGGNSTITAGTLSNSGTVGTAAAGFAVGDSNQAAGVVIDKATINASKAASNGGAIILNGSGYASAANAFGVEVLGGGILETNGTGTINVAGQGGGGSSGSHATNYGVYVTGSSSTIKTTGTGLLEVTGTGGTSGSATGATNIGVYVAATNGIQGTSTGDIRVEGTGGAGKGASEYGIEIGGSISGGGNTVINGTGGTNASGGNDNYGVYITGTNTTGISTSGGNIVITGAGGGKASSTGDYGIYVLGTGNATTGNPIIKDTSTTSGADNITLSGTTAGTTTLGIYSNNSGNHQANFIEASGGNVTLSSNEDISLNYTNINYNSGQSMNVILDSDDTDSNGSKSGAIALVYSDISTNGGNIILGGGTSPTSMAAIGDATNINGIFLNGFDTLNAAGGNISLIGNGYNGSEKDNGIYIAASTVETSGTGNITMTGTGGASTGGQNSGIYIANGGTGGNSLIQFGSGTLTMTGTASGQSGYMAGVSFDVQTTITATAAGTIIIHGTGSQTDSNSIYSPADQGVNMAGSVTSAGGNITITGTGGTAGGGYDAGQGDDGVYIGAATISTSGTGTVTISGTGNSGAALGNNVGVAVTADSTITTASGAISITGIAGNGGTGDYGFYSDNTGVNKIGTTSSPATGGNITIIADTWDIANTSDFAITTTGNVLIEPYTSGKSIGVGSTASGNLSFSDGVLGDIMAGTLTIGDGTNTSAMDIDTTYTFAMPTTFVTNGGAITLDSSVASSVSSGTALTFSNAVNANVTGTVSSAGGGIDFASTINGGHALTVNADTGAVSFGGAVGGSNALTSLSATGATIAINGGGVTTSGTQSYTGAVTLGADDVLTTTNSPVSFSSTVNGTHALTVAAGSGTVTYGGIVGGTGILSSLSDTGSGSTLLDASVTTSGNQGYTGAVSLGGDATITSNTGSVIFAATLDSSSATARNLTIMATSGNVTFGGAVGSIHPLASLTVDPNTIYISGNVTTTGAQDYADAVVLEANATLATTNANITFGATVDGDGVSSRSLTVSDGTATASFAGAIGGAHPLSNLSITTDNLTFGGNVYGTGTLTLAPSTAGRAINLNNGTSGLYLSSAEISDIQSGWGGIVIGTTADTGKMTVGTATWASPISLLSGAGDIEFAGAQNAGANTFFAYSQTGNMTLDSGATITSTATGNAIVVAMGGIFTNDSGTTTPFSAANGRYIGYSNKKADDINSTTDAPQQITGYDYGTLAPSAIVPAAYSGAENTWVYDTTSGSITLTAIGQNITYGSLPNLVSILGTTYSFTCSDGCSSSVLTGGPALSVNDINSLGLSGSGNRNVGNWQISLSGATDNNGYTINYVSGTLKITPKDLNISGLTGTVDKTYDGTTTATLAAGNYTTDAISGDNVNVSTTAGTYATKNVGTGIGVTVNGLAITGADAGDYNLVTSSVSGNVGEIDARAITITAQANTKTYDGGTSSATNAAITSGSLATGDTLNLAEVYTDKNAGTGKTLTASGDLVSDGNAGNDYSYTYVNNTSGVINQATLTLTAATNTKTYDASTSAAATPIVSGLMAGDSVTGLAEAYADPNAETGKTLNVSAYTINDGNGGNNYIVDTVPNNTGVISQATLTITAATNSRTYDGGTDAAATPTVQGLQGSDTVTGLTEAYAGKDAGSGLTLNVTGYTVNDGNSGNNYTVELVSNTTGVISPEALTITASVNSRTYDGGTDAAALPAITSGSIMAGDTASFLEAYASRNAGSNITLTTSGNVTDGNGGNNYTYTFVPAATGTITPEAITITASANSKAYDGTLTAAAAPPITAGTLMAGDTLSGITESYSSKNAGTSLTLTPSGSVSDGNGGNNYAVTFVPANNGTITAVPLAITAKDLSMTYADGTTLNGATGFTASGLVAGDTIGSVMLATNATTSASGNYNVGTWSITPSNAAGGNFLASNYSITYNNAPLGLTVTPKTLTIAGMTASNKTYDSTTAATIDNAADQLSGLVAGDDVSFSASTTASFATAAAGSNKLVTASGFTLSGSDAADYILLQPTAYASITGSADLGGSADIATVANPFFCTAGNEDSRNASCTVSALASRPTPIHTFYKIPTNLMLIHEEPMWIGDDAGR